MAPSIVRSSKYRHVFGTTAKRDLCYENMNTITSSAETNHIAANGKYFCVAWRAGGGAVAVVKHDKVGKVTETPLITGHSSEVIDFQFSPYNDQILATGSADTAIKIWEIPEDGYTANESECRIELSGHSKKISALTFHPTAENVLASISWDGTVKTWDMAMGEEKSSIAVGNDTLLTAEWSYDGATIATTCKDKKLRLLDTRAGKEISCSDAHASSKGSRCLYLGKTGLLMTSGFSKISERQLMFWDPRNMAAPAGTLEIDVASGALMPFYDEDTSILYVGGKGDADIKYFEIVGEAPFAFSLSAFRDKNPQKGLCMFPKRACDVMGAEVGRFLRLTDKMVEPVSFTVPRKGDSFQEDIFVDSRSVEPAMTSAEFFGGATRPPKYASMKPGATAARTVSAMKTPLQLKDERIAELEAEVAALKAEIATLKG